MTTLTVTFRDGDERDRVDLTRIGNPAGASDDGLSVRLEDVDVAEFKRDGDADDSLAALRAAFAACGVWPTITTDKE